MPNSQFLFPFIKTVIIFLYLILLPLQGVLLHPDGEVRKAGAERGHQEPGRLEDRPRLRALQGPQPSLQQKQPH